MEREIKTATEEGRMKERTLNKKPEVEGEKKDCKRKRTPREREKIERRHTEQKNKTGQTDSTD